MSYEMVNLQVCEPVSTYAFEHWVNMLSKQQFPVDACKEILVKLKGFTALQNPHISYFLAFS